ncbi:MAG: alpha/beta hydrolase [Candidatus Binatia bacterium]|nr:alpha/beta hydrolase [Candidatus Binatia bacterium]
MRSLQSRITILLAALTMAVGFAACGSDSDGGDDGGAPATAEITEITIEANGFVFDALAAGPADGEPVMLLHGFPQTAWEWEHQLSALGAAGYRAVAPNQRGYSPGARPEAISDYNIVALVGDVVAMADTLGFERFHLVGHDWGASVTWLAGLLARDRIASLVPISVPHIDAFSRTLADPDSCQPASSSYFDLFVQPDSEDLFLVDDAALLRSIYDGLTPEQIERHLTVMNSKEALRAGLHWYRANVGATSGGEGPGIGNTTQPTMYIWSDGDPALCIDGALLTEEYVDGPYRFEIIEGVNHWVPELAAEKVSALLLEHLAGLRD